MPEEVEEGARGGLEGAFTLAMFVFCRKSSTSVLTGLTGTLPRSSDEGLLKADNLCDTSVLKVSKSML